MSSRLLEEFMYPAIEQSWKIKSEIAQTEPKKPDYIQRQNDDIPSSHLSI